MSDMQVPNVEPMLMPVARLPKETLPKRNSQTPAPESKPAAPSSGTSEPPSPPKPDVVITVVKAASALTVTTLDGAVVFYAPVTTGSEHDPCRSASGRSPASRGIQRFTTTPSVLGCRSGAREGDDPGRTQQPGGRGVDRHLERPLRAARHAGAARPSAGRSRTAACG